MEPLCIRHTELPRASKLFTDYLYHHNRVAPFYGGNPSEPDAYRDAAAKIHFPEARRAAIVSALREQNGDARALERLARPGAVAVVTGQQVGLFSGPCYAIYKALTAIRLARKLSSEGIPAVPLFWMATEDHDFAEVSHCWSFNAKQEPIFLKLEAEDAGNRPVGGIPLQKPPLNELRSSLSRLPFGDEIATLADVSYAPGRTMGEAFRSLLERVLPSGLLYLDPLHPSIRTLAAPILREGFAANADLNQLLLARAAELDKAGYHAQVHVDANTSLFFHLRNGHRLPLRRRGSEYQAGERRMTASELMDDAGSLSPNALMRPVVQDYILPTVAYVGGPAEIAYLAQSQVIYKTILGRMPVSVPRSTFTVLDSRAAKLMKRYEGTLHDFFHGLDSLEARIAAHLIPEELAESLVSATDSITGHIEELRSSFDAFDPTLAAALDKSRAKILHQLARMERKVAREALRREDRAEAEAAYLYNLVYPRKHPQERMYSVVPFLARHGLDFVDRVYENVHLDCPDHVVFMA
jgi:bacillithiol biosynthesis cysteine-adding enzyme BshC